MPTIYRISQPGRVPITDVDRLDAVAGAIRAGLATLTPVGPVSTPDPTPTPKPVSRQRPDHGAARRDEDRQREPTHGSIDHEPALSSIVSRALS
jgi:hypothetical protein